MNKKKGIYFVFSFSFLFKSHIANKNTCFSKNKNKYINKKVKIHLINIFLFSKTKIYIHSFHYFAVSISLSRFHSHDYFNLEIRTWHKKNTNSLDF